MEGGGGGGSGSSFSSSSAVGNNNGNSNNNNGNAPRYVEFKLKSKSSSEFLHNIMTLAGPLVDMADFTTPVRLVRDPSCKEGGEGIGLEDSENNARMARRKRKTRIIHPEDGRDEDNEASAGEKVPWLLEDFDGQHSYGSTLMTPESRYVIFVNQGNEFRVLQASKWYKFAPKLSYIPLTLEEAEEKMASKGKGEDFDRWLMRRRATTSPIEGSSVATAPAKAKFGRKMETRFVDLDEEGFDFTEFVDDDDGEGLYQQGQGENEDDPSMPKLERRSANGSLLTDAGKKVKKLMKSLGKSSFYNRNDSDSDDDEIDGDPYADDDDQAMNDDNINGEQQEPVEKTKPTIPSPPPPTSSLAPTTTTNIGKRPPTLFERTAPSSSQSQKQQQQQQQHSAIDQLSRSTSPSISATPSTSNKARSPSPAIGSSTSTTAALLSEMEIVAILKEGPIRTKDLISRVKSKLKADPQNKEKFREIVRKVASVRPSISQDEDKMLELKAEYQS